ncbi:DNA-entry nuclease [Clostridium botulinum]|uniref:DNA-entry nuclease n=1 Tax=Clostridium botulinum TaxID=1491 RepID=A0AAU8Z1R8_CLOBO|nr:hypothetical protein [Clostridium sporogenes]AVP66345.1 DNA-entry nuclease [Clostridium botulinum]MCF4017064.1 hypothetical protein [Clostridium sporogenes]
MIEKYDSYGRLKYNPFYHPNQGKGWLLEDLIYICRFSNGRNAAELALAVGRTQATTAFKLHRLKKNGQFEYYKKLYKDWEKKVWNSEIC